MARDPGTPSDDARQLIAGHAAQSEALLRKAGVTDPLWLQAVEPHHQDGSLQMQPVLRNTTVRKHAVSHGVRASSVRVRLHHMRVLAARQGG